MFRAMVSGNLMVPLTTATVIALLVLSVFVCSCRAKGANDDSSEVFNQHFSNSAREDTGHVTDQNDIPNLSDIVQKTLASIFSKNAHSQTSISPEEEQLNMYALTKRIFCNGFSDCASAIKNVERLQQADKADSFPRLLKRPFCNSHGCYNSGRKRSKDDIVLPSADRNRVVQTDGHKVVAFDDAWARHRIKRLFCNGYGGCQNFGKRNLKGGSQEDQDVSAEFNLRPAVSPGHVQVLKTRKRFFTSSFDEDMEKLLENMKGGK